MKYIVFGIVCCFFGVAGFAQQSIEPENLPSQIQRFFPVVYNLPDDVPVDWTLEDSVYVAHFISASYPVEVRFKENGFWIITYWELDPIYLPISVKEYLNIHFADYSVDKARITNNPFEERFYVLKLIPPDGNSQPEEVMFLLNGQFVEQ